MPTIAIIGASQDRAKFGNKAVRAYQSRGYQVFPIHPREQTIEGLPAYASIKDVPVEALDRISLYLPPHLLEAVLPDLVSKAPGEVWFNPGTANPELLEHARRLGLRVIEGCSIVDIGVSPSDLP